MDTILLRSKFIKSIIAKLIMNQIKKNMSVDTGIVLNQLDINTNGEKVTIRVDGELSIRKDDFMKLVLKEEEES